MNQLRIYLSKHLGISNRWYNLNGSRTVLYFRHPNKGNGSITCDNLLSFGNSWYQNKTSFRPLTIGQVFSIIHIADGWIFIYWSIIVCQREIQYKGVRYLYSYILIHTYLWYRHFLRVIHTQSLVKSKQAQGRYKYQAYVTFGYSCDGSRNLYLFTF